MATTRETFDRMAPGWYGFRHRTIFQAELTALARRWQAGRLLNLGCAHGPDFLPFKEGFELHGVDISPEMLKMAQKYAQKYAFSVELARADMRCLPYAAGTFPWAIAVASFHHLGEPADRLAAFRELRRVLRPGGEALITVWNRWQPRFWSAGREVMVPWRAKAGTVSRYYYLFTYPELGALAREAGLTVLKSFPESRYRLPLKYFSRNICLLVKK